MCNNQALSQCSSRFVAASSWMPDGCHQLGQKLRRGDPFSSHQSPFNAKYLLAGQVVFVPVPNNQ